MIPLNYASLEAAQRLDKARVVLKTERGWFYSKKYGWTDHEMIECEKRIPRASFAEMWRELPGDASICKMNGNNYTLLQNRKTPQFGNTNPTDALIDLLIWVTEQKRKEKL